MATGKPRAHKKKALAGDEAAEGVELHSLLGEEHPFMQAAAIAYPLLLTRPIKG